MPVNLSIKNAPDALAAKLKARAASNHRSLQGEMLSILSQAVEQQDAGAIARRIIADAAARGWSTPDEAADMLREDRSR